MNSYYVVGEIGRNEKTQKDIAINCSIFTNDEMNSLFGDVIEHIKKHLYVSKEIENEDDAKKLLYEIDRHEI